jgi:hypothetical protein
MSDQDENLPADDRDQHARSDPGDPGRDHETWYDTDAAEPGKVIGTKDLTKEMMQFITDREARHHVRTMQIKILSGVGLIFIGTILTLVAALGLGLIPPEFGSELMRMVIPTVLGAGLTIVGTFFRDGGGGGSKPS